MKDYSGVKVEEIEARLAQFLKPEFMPVTPARLSVWVEEAEENDGQVRADSNWTISGHEEVFTL